MLKGDIREKPQQFTRSNLTLDNKENLDEWKTTWSGIDALSGRMGLIEKFCRPLMHSITKKGRAMMKSWFKAREREGGEKEGRRGEEEEEKEEEERGKGGGGERRRMKSQEEQLKRT